MVALFAIPAPLVTTCIWPLLLTLTDCSAILRLSPRYPGLAVVTASSASFAAVCRAVCELGRGHRVVCEFGRRHGVVCDGLREQDFRVRRPLVMALTALFVAIPDVLRL